MILRGGCFSDEAIFSRQNNPDKRDCFGGRAASQIHTAKNFVSLCKLCVEKEKTLPDFSESVDYKPLD